MQTTGSVCSWPSLNPCRTSMIMHGMHLPAVIVCSSTIEWMVLHVFCKPLMQRSSSLVIYFVVW